tara:strand:+ start:396 stop:746 length:351 start_codon:yes stop_codon:yes gene_type:complete
MSIAARILVAVLALGALIFVIHLVRLQVLKAKYSILWLATGVGLAIAAAVPGFLDWSAELLGIWYQPTLFLLLAIGFLLLLTMHFSYELSRMESRIRHLAEELALIRKKINPPDDN